MNLLRISPVFFALSAAACAAAPEADTAEDQDVAAADLSLSGSLRADRNTCRTVQRFVRSHGAVNLYSGPDTFMRVVANRGSCGIGEFSQPYWVATTDDDECFAGYTCGGSN